MKRVFIVAGELSGDKLGKWYADKIYLDKIYLDKIYLDKIYLDKIYLEGVGGDFMQSAGVKIYERFERLNIVGIVEIIKHLRSILSFMKELSSYITNKRNNFDEVVVIDFPGFNLRLIKKIKKINSNIKITYLSPPQLWAWGEGRVKIIKKYCDRVIVLYPFEVDWYKSRGVKVDWLGYPFYKNLEKYFDLSEKKEKLVALIPGSRSIEIKRLLPLFAKVVKRVLLLFPDIRVIVPLAKSIDERLVKKILIKEKISKFSIISGEANKLKMLSKCFAAISKPGTVTLELGLLKVPTIVAYKASYLSYFIAKSVVKIDHMSLPNLLLKEEIFKEFIQFDCTEEKLVKALKLLCSNKIYKQAQRTGPKFNKLRNYLSP